MKNLFLLIPFICMGLLLHAQSTNNALHFDGINDFVAIPSVATNMNAFTIETWIYPNTIPASGDIAILSTNTWDVTNGGSVHFQFENGYIVLSVNGIAGGWPAMKTKLTANTWQHIAVTFDKANSLVCFYLNGVLDNSITRTLPTAKISAAEIGAWNNSRYFNGKFDEFRIWNVARSASDIAKTSYRSIAHPSTTPGLIAYYSFEHGTANGNNTEQTTLTDLSASGFNGTLINFDLGTSNWGEKSSGNNFLAFDGTDDYVDMGTSEAIDFSDGFSFTGLVKWDKFNDWSRIIDFGNGAGSDNILIANNSTQSTITFSIRKGTVEKTITSGKVLNANQWYYLAFTVSDAGVVSLYFDGVLDKSVSGFNLPNTLVRSNQYIGKSNWSGNGYFDGSIDFMGIWNKALTQSEITAGASGFIGNESGLVHYYSFDQGSADGDNTGITTLYDMIGTNTKNGTLTNFRLTPYAQSNWVEGKDFFPPVITSFFPKSGAVGTTVTINGTNFNSSIPNDVVYFGSVKATVTAASENSLTVTVPPGAGCLPISVTNTSSGLTAYTFEPFTTTFSCGGAIVPTTFAKDAQSGYSSTEVSSGDFDGDGKPDLAFINNSADNISVLRNTSTSGVVSFASNVDFATGNNPIRMGVGDFDGDGKLDIVAANGWEASISILRNTSIPGTVSFAAKVDFGTGLYPQGIASGDLNGDGLPDLAIVNTSSNSVSILRNISTPGTVSFATKVDIGTTMNPINIRIDDIDGDKKPEVTYITSNDQKISVLRNISTIDTVMFEANVDFTTGSTTANLSIRDLDGDGKHDLAVTNHNFNTISLFLNTSTIGVISFASKVDYATGQYPSGISMNDLDGDAKPELVIANSNDNSVMIMRNTCSQGTIRFAPRVDYDFSQGQYQSVIEDFDLDGKPDIATNNFLMVLRNLGSVPAINTINTGVWSDSVLSITPIDSIDGFVPSGTTYSWGAPTVTGGVTGGTGGSGSSIINTLHNPTAIEQTAIYTVNPGCTGNPFIINVSIGFPPTVSTQPITGISYTTVTGNGNIESLGSPDPTQYGFVWSTSANPTVVLSTKTELGTATTTGAFTSNINGLTPNTTYYAKAYATNAGGTVYGEEVTFKTLLAAPPVVITQAVSNILVNSAMGNGNLVSLGDINPSQYGVVWSTSPNPTIAFPTKTEEGAATTTGAFTSLLTGLTSKTTYYVRAYAISISDTVYGGEVSFTTLDESKTVTNNSDSGPGSLRNVINTIGEGDTIVFASDMTITLASQLDLGTKSLVIDGRDKKITISGDHTCRVFYIAGTSGKTFAFNNLNICNGFVPEGFIPTTSGGGLCENLINGTLRVSNCTFSNNTATDGGGVYAGNGSTFSNCTFSKNTARNYGGGVHTSNGAYFSNCTFKENSAAIAGGVYANLNYVFIDCSFNRNTVTTYSGGGVWLDGGGTVTNCTFNGNSAKTGGSGAFISNGASVFSNCIFWNSLGSEIGSYSTDLSVNYCAVRGGYSSFGAGTGIKTLTISPFAGDTLSTLNKIAGGGLECIDAGLNSANTKPTDIRGEARIQHTTIDMGAYESTPGVDTESVSGNLSVYDQWTSSTSSCLNAFDTIIVAGRGTPVISNSGTSVTLIAGKAIRFLPGFQAQSGCYLDAYITTNSTFCYEVMGSGSMVELPVEKSLQKQTDDEMQNGIPDNKTVKVYPNPNTGSFTLELTNFEPQVNVAIYNLLGKKVARFNRLVGTQQPINLEGIRKGIYFVEVSDGKNKLMKKMIVN